jgi:membrane-associated protein
VFLLWQVIGGAVWAVGLIVAGHLLGTYIPGPVVALVVVVSLLPVAIELVRERRRRRPSGRG